MSKAQISKIIQSGGFLKALLSKLEVPLEVAVPLTKTYFRSIRNNSWCFRNSCRNLKKKKSIDLKLQLTNSNEIMNGVMKIFQALKDSNILL